MADRSKLEVASINEVLDRLPYAITLSDLSAKDQPLIYFNEAFRSMTGCTQADLGRNCRFLQADFDNETARAEIRLALSEKRRTQVVLRNRRMDGTPFHNLLLLEYIGPFANLGELALGTQFVLNDEEREALDNKSRTISDHDISRAKHLTFRTRLDQRRVAAESTIQLLKSWAILQSISLPA